jgi:hypothetical protein
VEAVVSPQVRLELDLGGITPAEQLHRRLASLDLLDRPDGVPAGTAQRVRDVGSLV